VKGDIEAQLSSVMCHCSRKDSDLYAKSYSFTANWINCDLRYFFTQYRTLCH